MEPTTNQEIETVANFSKDLSKHERKKIFQEETNNQNEKKEADP